MISNVTLTTEPGVEVRFAPNTRLSVNGTLHAVGMGGVSNVLIGAHTWEQMWLPYVAYGIITVDQRGEVYVNPGVEIRFDDGARLMVCGWASLAAVRRSAPARSTETPVTGSVTATLPVGPVTAPDGRVIATVSAGSPGEAELAAALEDLDGCSYAVSKTARITFEKAGSASPSFVE